eukprot:TRINITY_DN7020_c0_g1_i1.p1 TRINITY_DN7020_c0_g1~~TRINITY_DN7020_c0_g1_i1.p1  ORF type:complete len:401 (-),score=113.18 TRINITY_DN7020_c0_g1_i1:22-1224(-)
MAEVEHDVPEEELAKMSLESKPKDADEVGHEVEAEHHGEMMSMMKQMKLGTDLEFVSTPSFILRPESGLETSASNFDRADAFASIPDSDDPLERILAVAKFAIGGYSLSAGKSTKKPYNPVLGEIIELVWDMGKAGGRQRYTAEQVSHHPPVAAAVAMNKKKGVFMNFGQMAKAKFWGTSVMIKSNGTAELYLTKFGDETYEFNFPDLKISGFLWGRITLEWVGTVDIVCQKTGYKCQVEFKPKPWFRGKYHCVSGKVSKLDDTKFKNPVATFEGKWTETIELKYTKSGNTVKMFDAADKPTPRVEKELEELDEWDSRRIWAKVTEHILKKDFKTANVHKNLVEEDQRKRIKAMPGGEASYEGKLFHKDPNAPESNRWRYKKLDHMIEKSRKKFAEKAEQ